MPRRANAVVTAPAGLGRLVADVCDVREELRRQGASDRAIAEATERLVRDRWPFAREWKYLCEQCDDTGLVLSLNVRNRLGIVVDEGRPCVCSKGDRFRKPEPSFDDFQQAGKVPKSKPMSRWGR